MVNFYTKYIPGNTYNNMLANNLIDLPVYLASGIIMHYLGIKITFVIGSTSSILGGILLILYGGPDLQIPGYAYIFIISLAKGGALINSSAS